MFVCIPMTYVQACLHTYIHIHIHTLFCGLARGVYIVCMYAYMYVCMYVSMHITSTYILACAHSRVGCMCGTYIHAYMHTHTYAEYIRILTFLHIHTYMHTDSSCSFLFELETSFDYIAHVQVNMYIPMCVFVCVYICI
jgi:hypothetical protein